MTLLVDSRQGDVYKRHMPITVRKTAVFNQWLSALPDETGTGAITARIARIEGGLMGDVRSLGQGLSEIRVKVGPGYRVYMTQHGKAVILLLCGGDKSTQRRDIKVARAMISVLAAEKKAKGKSAKKK